MYLVEELIGFLKELSGADKIKPTTDIFEDILVGDDFHEMVEKYAKKYSVEMKGYLWYFHTDEENAWNSIGAYFFKPPYQRVERIPVTPSMLTDFANRGKWDINYPQHTLPKRRYDILINQILAGVFLVGVFIWLLKSYS